MECMMLVTGLAKCTEQDTSYFRTEHLPKSVGEAIGRTHDAIIADQTRS